MSTPVEDPAPTGRGYRPEPWDTPDRQHQAIAHENALRQRRRRQRLMIGALLLAMLLIFLLVLTSILRRGGHDSGAQSPQNCPTPSVAKPAATKVRVLNATGRSGLAAAVAKTLKGRGYDVGTVSNAQTGVTGSVPALVVHGSGQEAQARAAAAQVGGARLKSDSRSSDTVDLILGKSFTSLRSPQDAAADLKQADVPAGCPTGS